MKKERTDLMDKAVNMKKLAICLLAVALIVGMQMTAFAAMTSPDPDPALESAVSVPEDTEPTTSVPAEIVPYGTNPTTGTTAAALPAVAAVMALALGVSIKGKK